MMLSIIRESILLRMVSKSIRAGTQCDPDAARLPIRLPRMRGSVTMGVRRCTPMPSADGDLPSRLALSVLTRIFASEPKITSELGRRASDCRSEGSALPAIRSLPNRLAASAEASCGNSVVGCASSDGSSSGCGCRSAASRIQSASDSVSSSVIRIETSGLT